MLVRGADRHGHFDLEADPQELVDLAGRPESKPILDRCLARLRGFLDPEDTDRRAKARQRELIDFYGGEEAIRKIAIGNYARVLKSAMSARNA